MKKIIRIIYIILILILIKLIISFTLNEIYISKYEKGIYKENLVKILEILNYPESYIAHYNHGNYYYQNEKYTEAINEYDKALKSKPPKGKECRIRINKALCILKSVDLENKKAEENIEILYKAREVLCEQGCANTDNPNGHSKQAEQLKKEIDELIEKLKEKNQSEDPEEPDEPEPQPQPSQSPDNKESNYEDKKKELEKRKKEAEKDRKEGLTSAGNLEGNTNNWGYGKKNW